MKNHNPCPPSVAYILVGETNKKANKTITGSRKYYKGNKGDVCRVMGMGLFFTRLLGKAFLEMLTFKPIPKGSKEATEKEKYLREYFRPRKQNSENSL